MENRFSSFSVVEELHKNQVRNPKISDGFRQFADGLRQLMASLPEEIMEKPLRPEPIQLAYILDDLNHSREKLMGYELTSLGEHAWTILLRLYTDDSKGLKITVSNITLGSYIPPTTALRYIDALVKRGYVNRWHSEHDKRLTYLRLTENAKSDVTRILYKISQKIY